MVIIWPFELSELCRPGLDRATACRCCVRRNSCCTAKEVLEHEKFNCNLRCRSLIDALFNAD